MKSNPDHSISQCNGILNKEKEMGFQQIANEVDLNHTDPTQTHLK